MKTIVPLLIAVSLLAGCSAPPPSKTLGKLDPNLVIKGRDIFFNEKFGGNGRTCGTCHPANNNLVIDPAFIAGLPDDDPLFVAEFNPALRNNFEKPRLMRQFGLILENRDGFGDLDSNFVMRGVPHLLGLARSVGSGQGPRTGWAGDGAPGDGSLRSFSTGAIIQHFPKTLDRIPGKDFRLPTEKELDALNEFMLSLGRSEELRLPLPMRNPGVKRGQEIFLSPTEGKCFACHLNAGANADPAIFGIDAGNLNFNTGVENLPDQPRDFAIELIPPDDGFGARGDSTFNTPSLLESADTGPFFHNNSVETIEGAVAFYNGGAFNNSPAGLLLRNATGSGIDLDATQVVQVAAFLRVINALENIRQSRELLYPFASKKYFGTDKGIHITRQVNQAMEEMTDAIDVLRGGGLHPKAVESLRKAVKLTKGAFDNHELQSKRLVREAVSMLDLAQGEILRQP